MNILEIKDLNKSFKNFSLKNITFSLPKGYIMGFIGPNGAGKSTTIKLIMNLIKKDSGSIKVFGMDNITHENEIKNRIGFVYDENYYFEELTMGQIEQIISPLYKNWDKKKFREYMALFNLDEKQIIKELSKGMKIKFSFVVALSHGAELLIMDEPTSGLDPVIRDEILQLLSQIIQDEEKAVFFSTHITSDLDKIADYITFINDGKLIFSEEKDIIFDEYAIVKGKNELLNNNELKNMLIGLKENAYGFEGLTKNKYEVIKKFSNNILIEKPNLEDILLYHTGRVSHV